MRREQETVQNVHAATVLGVSSREGRATIERTVLLSTDVEEVSKSSEKTNSKTLRSDEARHAMFNVRHC